MKQLREEIETLLNRSKCSPEEIALIMREKELYPFSRESRILVYLMSLGKITYDEYVKLDRDYCGRNQYLELFEMAPRTYGQTWGEEHIRKLFPQFVKATKENLVDVYPAFDGEFDLWLDGIRIEVKACRANSTKGSGSLASRAYLHTEANNAGFKYHYQQLKPSCCDVFIWIGTCRDTLLYWVLSSNELLETGKLGSQHRNEHTGTADNAVFEGQVFMTEEELLPFAVKEENILTAVYAKSQIKNR